MAAPNIHKPILLILLSLLIIAASTEAQMIGINDSNPKPPNFQPTMAFIVAIIFCVAVLLGLYCYRRNFLNIAPNLFEATAGSLLGRKKACLDPAFLHSFPVMLYSGVKDQKIGSSSLECAVCINEFENRDSIRLLPKCSHMFHEECIDAWLGSHVTCPVCRAVLEKDAALDLAAEEQVEVVVVVVEERRELARIRGRTRLPGGVRRQIHLMRSHTTGHLAAEDLERCTLQLPETARNDIFVPGRLKREWGFPARGPNKGEGDVGSSGRRSLMLGLSTNWPSLFLRSLSAKGFSVGLSKGPENSSVKQDLPI